MAKKEHTELTDDISFEQAYKELEEIVERMEQGDQALEQSLADFERGVALMKICHSNLSNAEQKVQKLVKDNEGLFNLEPFDKND
jgi:exodeoxyribonuclease VII small subunit